MKQAKVAQDRADVLDVELDKEEMAKALEANDDSSFGGNMAVPLYKVQQEDRRTSSV